MLCEYRNQSNGRAIRILAFEQSVQILTEGAHCNQSIRTQMQMNSNMINDDLRKVSVSILVERVRLSNLPKCSLFDNSHS